MSQIFDALQRSEAERSKTDVSELPDAIEVLRRAERHATLKLEYPGQPDESESNSIDQPAQSFQPQPLSTDITAAEPAEATQPGVSDGVSSILVPFPSLKLSLPSPSCLVCLTEQASPAAESFRLLGVRLSDLRRERPLKKVLITSTIPQEGKSMVAANLAGTLAQRQKERILLLEGDVRRPSLSNIFGIGDNAGICEWLLNKRSLLASIYHLEDAGLWILPAGKAPSNPLELLQSGKLPALMDELGKLFDWIIIDSPPILPLADTSVWMRLADGVLLVTRQGVTVKRQLKRGLEAIESQKLIGALINSSNTHPHSDYYYGMPETSNEDHRPAD
jgi:capsular exopolysaccharide synthesis family protein